MICFYFCPLYVLFLLHQYYFLSSRDDYNGMNECMLANTIAYEFYTLVIYKCTFRISSVL